VLQAYVERVASLDWVKAAQEAGEALLAVNREHLEGTKWAGA